MKKRDFLKIWNGKNHLIEIDISAHTCRYWLRYLNKLQGVLKILLVNCREIRFALNPFHGFKFSVNENGRLHLEPKEFPENWDKFSQEEKIKVFLEQFQAVLEEQKEIVEYWEAPLTKVNE